jgi:hypothetical protein
VDPQHRVASRSLAGFGPKHPPSPPFPLWRHPPVQAQRRECGYRGRPAAQGRGAFSAHRQPRRHRQVVHALHLLAGRSLAAVRHPHDATLRPGDTATQVHEVALHVHLVHLPHTAIASSNRFRRDHQLACSRLHALRGAGCLTCKLNAVTFVAPKRPAIFLPFKTRAGPTEPIEPPFR